MFPVTGGVFPKELNLCVVSHFNRKDFESVRYVSKEWNRLEGLDETWRALFLRFFKENAPLNTPAKASFFYRHGLPISSLETLCRIYTVFRCHLDWNKKQCFMVFFPTATYTAIFEVALGPDRATSEGFKAPADESSYYRYVADPPKDFLQVKETVWSDLKMAGIPLRKSRKGNLNPCFFPTRFLAKMGVDVGYGNTLAYFSSINDWKAPFRLFCVSNPCGGHSWNGYIPYAPFKFVKMGGDGSITWESHTGVDQNRVLTADICVRPCSWERYMAHFPIRFPN